ncbi:hypothetical protein [Kitasatospora sp. NPDC050543]|uniref:hypothetical protein n=1 Tax=Kitasatospora sp. NPDC050543 TaxID=3364054 RepID=UPI0037A8ABD9
MTQGAERVSFTESYPGEPYAREPHPVEPYSDVLYEDEDEDEPCRDRRYESNIAPPAREPVSWLAVCGRVAVALVVTAGLVTALALGTPALSPTGASRPPDTPQSSDHSNSVNSSDVTDDTGSRPPATSARR